MQHTLSEMVGAEKTPIFDSGEAYLRDVSSVPAKRQVNIEPDEISTSIVERNNLTIRTFMKRFARPSLGFSKKLENLAAAVALQMAYYNSCRCPATLGGYKTPAEA